MKLRHIAKRYGRGWGVYDTMRGSWPVQVPGFGRVEQELPTEALAIAEADRLEAHGGLPAPRG